MDIAKLIGLRPKKQTAETIQASIHQTDAELKKAQARIAELNANRGKLMLSGDAKAVEAGETELSTLEEDVERYQALLTALQPMLDEALVQERVAEFATLQKSAEQDASAFTTWWKDRYPVLAAEIREGLLKERQAEENIRKLEEMSFRDPAAFQASKASVPKRPIDRINPDNANTSMTIGAVVRLPPASGQTAADLSGYVWGGVR